MPDSDVNQNILVVLYNVWNTAMTYEAETSHTHNSYTDKVLGSMVPVMGNANPTSTKSLLHHLHDLMHVVKKEHLINKDDIAYKQAEIVLGDSDKQKPLTHPDVSKIRKVLDTAKIEASTLNQLHRMNQNRIKSGKPILTSTSKRINAKTDSLRHHLHQIKMLL